MPYRRIAMMLLLLCVFAWPISSQGQSNIVLRDLTLISNRTVESFDQDKVRLNDGSELSWDKILQGRVAADRQVEFDRNLREIGLPLYQLKQRIKIGDWVRLHEVADSLLVRYSGIDSAIAKTVCLAAAKGKSESGRRVEAVLPFLMASVKRASLPEDGWEVMEFSASDLEIGVASQLLPVWFDRESIKAQKSALEAYRIELGERFPDGGKVYLASFCLVLEQYDDTKRYADQVGEANQTLRQWKRLLLSEVDRRTCEDANQVDLFQADNETVDEVRAALAYFDALALDRKFVDIDSTSQILEYMKVPALWGERFPNIASAAIYRSIDLAKKSNMSEEAKTLAEELFRRYPKSYHGKLLDSETPSHR